MRKAAVVALAALSVLGVSACSTTAPQPDADGMTPITVGVVAAADYPAIYVAIEKGYFEEAGLDVSVELAQNAAAVAPSVLNGQYQFGGSAVAPFVSAVGQSLPLVGVANAANVPQTAEEDPSAIIASASSGITDVAGLAGKTVAVNQLGGAFQVATMAAAEKAGIDPTSIEFVAMGFPEMAGALERGDIQAGSMTEPFMTANLAQGGVLVANPFTEAFEKGGSNALYFAAKQYADSNPGVVEDFADALDKAAADVAADDDLARSALLDYMGFDAGTVEDMRLFDYTPSPISQSALETVADYMVEFGMLKEVPAGLEAAVWHAPES